MWDQNIVVVLLAEFRMRIHGRGGGGGAESGVPGSIIRSASSPNSQVLNPGFGVPYFNTFFLKGSLMKYKFKLFSTWSQKSPGIGVLTCDGNANILPKYKYIFELQCHRHI